MAAVYIPLSASANDALRELNKNFCSLQNKHPEACYVIVCDFNHAKLTDVLTKCHQHVSTATGGTNMLDRMQTNRLRTYRAIPRLHLCLPDHISIMLVPAYHTLLKSNNKDHCCVAQ